MVAATEGQDDGDPNIGMEPVTLPAGTRQDPKPVVPDTKPLRDPDSKQATPGFRDDVVLLPDAEGNLVPVPRGARLEDYLRFLAEERTGRPKDAVVVRVELDGTANQTAANLTVTLHVKVNTEGWVRLPLGLNEGVLRDYAHRLLPEPGQPAEHDAAGDDAADATFDERTSEEGYVWRFRGRGLHELRLELRVPVRLQSPTRRLQLQLPPTAVSSLRLDVPHNPVAVTAPAESQWTVEEDRERSTITVFGLGSRLAISWEPRPAPRAAGTALQATTAIDLRPNERTVVLEATQVVKVLRGTTESLRVRLPNGFELHDLTVRTGDGTARPETVRVELPEVVDGWTTIPLPAAVLERGQVDLEWTLESKVPRTVDTVQLDGFEIDKCRTQTGDIVLHGLAGHEVSLQSGRGVHRVDIAELGRSTGAVSAYRFLRHPFRIAVRISEIVPHFTAQPLFHLHAEPDAVRLSGEIAVKVYRGAVRSVSLEWPYHLEEGWVLDAPDAPGLVVDFEVIGDGSTTRLAFQFLEPTSGEFSLPIRALRPITPGAEPIPLHLPSMPASYRLPASVAVTRAVNTEVSLILDDDATIAVDPSDTAERPADIPEDALDVRSLRLEPAATSLPIVVETRVRSQTARDRTRVTADRRLHVDQRISYDVRYGFVRNLRFSAPEGAVFSIDGTPIVASIVERDDPADESDQPVVELQLPRPLTGRFEIHVSTTSDFPDAWRSLPASASIAFARPLDIDDFERRLLLGTSGGFVLTTNDNTWRRIGTAGGLDSWASEDADSAIVRIDRVESSGPTNTTVRRALVRTLVASDGSTQSWARFDITRARSPLIVTIPAGLRLDEVSWNGRPLEPGEIVVSPPESNRLMLKLGTSDADGMLLVRYHRRGSAALGWSSNLRLQRPDLPGTDWVEQVVWEVSLAPDQYVFVPPDRIAANYDWQRNPVFWERTTREGFENPVAWVGDRAVRAETLAFAGRHSYQYLGFGPVATIEFRTASRSCLVLFGAGLALAFGFVLLKIPSFRHMFVFLGIAFAVAIVAIWYSEPVLLLLQPAILGLGLAILTAAIDAVTTRRSGAPVLAVPSVNLGAPVLGDASTRTGIGTVPDSSDSAREAASTATGESA